MRKPYGYWKDASNIIAETKKAMKKHGWTTLPSANVLKEHGFGAPLDGAKHHGGITGLRKLLGQPERLRTENGLWRSESYLIQKTRQIMEKEGWETLPNQEILVREGYASIPWAAKNYHGGFRNLRKLLGEQPPQNKKKIWHSREYLVQAARQAMEEQGWELLPGAKTLNSHGYTAITVAAQRYHGGVPELRKLLGQQERLRIKDGLWRSQAYLIQQARNAMQEQGWTTLPSGNVLRKNGYSSLVRAVKYHDGMRGLRKLLGQKALKVENGQWRKPEFFVQKIREAMEQEGWASMPTSKTLRDQGYGSILFATRFHGGMEGTRQLLEQHSSQPSEQEQLEVLVGGYDA